MPSLRLKRSPSISINTNNDPADSVPIVAVAGPSEPPSATSDAPMNMQSLTGGSTKRPTGRPRSRTIATVFSSSPIGDRRNGYMRRITSTQDMHIGPHSPRTYQHLSDAGPNADLAPGSPSSRSSQNTYFLASPSASHQQGMFSSPSSIPENPMDQAPASAPSDMSPLAIARKRSRQNSSSSFNSPVDFRLPQGERGVTDEMIRRTSLERASMDLPPKLRTELRASFDKGPRSSLPGGSAERGLEDQMEEEEEEHHHDEVVEHLDVIDPGVSTISHLANAANSILIPPIFSSTRKPVVTLPQISLLASDSQAQLLPEHDGVDRAEKGLVIGVVPGTPSRREPLDELDLHVEHVLRKRDKAKRALKGLWAFLKTPMGIFFGIYGFLCAFWGAAIVLFLLKWINLHNDYDQKLWIEITCQIETGLFTITGVGLIPWRSIDTYRITRITHYMMKSRNIRKERGLKALNDDNDLPDPENGIAPDDVVLSEDDQKALIFQQEKFMKSQTWYRPHETETHRAFPITTALWICLLIDGNSIFQCMLCGTMWGLNMWDRPAWSTGTLVPASFLCGIAAAILIWRGGQNTKKIQEVEDKFRDALGVPEEDEPVKRSTSLKRIFSQRSNQSGVSGKMDKQEAKEEAAQGILEPGPSARTT
ncbi:hypothetical protein CALVIDRAFT_538651 [Calocera viscosa TUFC12733]|uniref:Uncharacterized protein n=1 Tax=Calocera viscosa (strain TUFC12733) TaxID=1330018 RepID=A0A167KPZ6_CALVF|nr:hypothetical protein CALVIDRAFT_538651 [Calocera viscosa TUFC12733]